jgi:hypothetical protein
VEPGIKISVTKESADAFSLVPKEFSLEEQFVECSAIQAYVDSTSQMN